jgi:ABC-2 type transport system permease protein
MNGFMVFTRKEAREILRTWRVWVLPGILLLFALTGPVLARFTPEIVGAVAGDQLGGLKLPTPTYLDAYTQWIKNLSQVAQFALIIIYGGIVSAEVKSGTAVLVLTKPVSRTAFVIATAAVHSVFLAVLVVVGTLLTWGITAAVFGKAPGSALWSSALAWLVFGVLFIALMTLLSVLIGSTAGAAGAGLGAYALVSIGDLETPRLVLTCGSRHAARLARSRQGRRRAVAGADIASARSRTRRTRCTDVPTQGSVAGLPGQSWPLSFPMTATWTPAEVHRSFMSS